MSDREPEQPYPVRESDQVQDRPFGQGAFGRPAVPRELPDESLTDEPGAPDDGLTQVYQPEAPSAVEVSPEAVPEAWAVPEEQAAAAQELEQPETPAPTEVPAPEEDRPVAGDRGPEGDREPDEGHEPDEGDGLDDAEGAAAGAGLPDDHRPAAEEGAAHEPDPFEDWPQPQSATVIEDVPDEGVSVEHVSGEIDIPDGYTVLEGTPTGHRRSVALVVSRFNGGLTNRMLARALDALDEAGVTPEAITIMPVPGAFELPLAAMALAKTRRYACVVALGAIVRGETPHFDYVASEAASGLQLAGIETGVPVAFGVLTVETIEQGEARIERAADAVRTALEMADVFAQLRAGAAEA